MIIPPLDSRFVPAILFHENDFSRQCFEIALKRSNGIVVRKSIETSSFKVLERAIKFLLWMEGGDTLYISGDDEVCNKIKKIYSAFGERSFDARLMSRVFGRDFSVQVVSKHDLPEAKKQVDRIGGHWKGNRIGFDLGASDLKVAAVQDGEVLFTDEFPWNPVIEKDPQVHYQIIQDALEKAASYLPHVDVIGGSSAGVIVDNKVKVASLFRSVGDQQFKDFVEPIFLNIGKKWNVPIVVANDGDVTALAGSISLKKQGILGIAMGSSEAVGFLNRAGAITGALNELAFAPVDYHDSAPADEWSGDTGVGANYFSQQAVGRLLEHTSIELKPDISLPRKLEYVQELVKKGNSEAEKIFATIGIYLGYTIPHYKTFYDFAHLLILGRVTSGKGGDIILENTNSVLKKEFPEVYSEISLNTPDEKSKRVGQAVAAATLPKF